MTEPTITVTQNDEALAAQIANHEDHGYFAIDQKAVALIIARHRSASTSNPAVGGEVAGLVERLRDFRAAGRYKVPLCEEAADTLLALQSRVTELEADAAAWRSLFACQRIRVMGFTHDGNHIGVEFWRAHPEAHPNADYPQEACRERFEAFARAALSSSDDQEGRAS